MKTRYPDVIVVGGGVIGMTCAWRLAGAGRRVVLLERERCGSGATSASLGALIPSAPTHRRAKQNLQRASLWMWPAFAEELCDCTGIDVDYRRCGSLDLPHSEQRHQQVIDETEIANRDWPAFDDGPLMKVFGAEDARALEPAVSFDEFGARLCRASAQVSVDILVHALRTACERASVDIREQCPVAELDMDGKRVSGARTAREMLPADAVLVAGGAWTASISPDVARCAPIVPVKGQAMALQVDGAPCRHIVKRRTSYVIPEGDSEALVGSTTEREAGFDVRSTAQGVADLASGALSLIPALESAQVVRTWAGLRPDSDTHHPVMGPAPDVEGLFVCSGHFKTGLSWAPMAGRIMLEWLTEGNVDEAARSFIPSHSAAEQ